jgi:hypothetical protein
MTNCWFASALIEFWLYGLTIYERQRALALGFHLEVLSSALSAQHSQKQEASNVVPFRRPPNHQAVVLELR